jgi:16S rRNA (cytosine1402-N4)-methyltransferase
MTTSHGADPSGDYHTPVLVDEVLTLLRPVPRGIYVDGTLGGGGHAEHMLALSSPDGRIIGFDQDTDALMFARTRLARFGDRVTFRKGNFSSLASALDELGIGGVQGILLDLGVSSHHLDAAGRGFSFQADAPIDMRMDREALLDAKTVVNTYGQDALSKVLWTYGEERNANRIARAIVRARERHAIGTTGELAAAVESAVGGKFLKKTLARVFQAVRIEVNRELDHLAAALRQGVDALAVGGRIVVISYHSLEDRIVKEFFRDEARTVIPSGHALVPDTPAEPRLRLLTRKPVEATPEESQRNPRSRSAKLRAAERI